MVAAVYPGVWGASQLLTGWLSDHTGRKAPMVVGMLIQAGALMLLVAGGGAFLASLIAAVLLGLGTALVYPTSSPPSPTPRSRSNAPSWSVSTASGATSAS